MHVSDVTVQCAKSHHSLSTTYCTQETSAFTAFLHSYTSTQPGHLFLDRRNEYQLRSKCRYMYGSRVCGR